MNELAVKQIHDDFKEILSTDAGKRVIGSIFYASGVNTPAKLDDYYQGRRSMGVTIANTLREIDPRLVAECEISYMEFIRSYDDGRDDRDDDTRDDAE